MTSSLMALSKITPTGPFKNAAGVTNGGMDCWYTTEGRVLDTSYLSLDTRNNTFPSNWGIAHIRGKIYGLN